MNKIEVVTNFLRQLPGIAMPLVIVVVVVVFTLRWLNGVPAYVENLVAGPRPPQSVLDERLSFSSIEAAERDLGVKVGVPVYFPSFLVWPPSSIRGQREPVRVVSLLFRSNDNMQGLQIREIFWSGEDLPFPVPEPLVVTERRGVDVDGVPGSLLVGDGQSGTAVNQLRWRAGGVHFIVTTVYPPEELLTIARSIR
jgi:hypothetical protein